MQTRFKNAAFSLIEMLAVVLIVGVLATLALPKLTFTIEKARASEGEQYLYSILGAQKRYSVDHDIGGASPVYADNVSDLDITLTTPNNFKALTDADISTTSPLARIIRSDDSYTLSISDTGVVSCSGGSVCQKLGYP